MTVKLAIDRNHVLITVRHRDRSTATKIWRASKSIDLNKKVNLYEHDDHSIKQRKLQNSQDNYFHIIY